MDQPSSTDCCDTNSDKTVDDATQRAYGREKLIHELFEEQVRHTPNSIAVQYGAQCLTYAQLNGRANQLAHALRGQRIRPDNIVALCVERGLERLVGVLGILKAGGAYLPLDTTHPLNRLQHMLNDAAPEVLLIGKDTRRSLPLKAAITIELDEYANGLTPFNMTNLDADALGLTAQHLAWVLYTSGSTGQPKGIGMEHHSLVNVVEWSRHNLHRPEAERTLQFSALGFDVACTEIFTTLCSGGTLILLQEQTRRDLRTLYELIQSQAVARLFLTPSVLHLMAESADTLHNSLQNVKEIITAGEQLRISPAICKFIGQLSGRRLHNHYGPTETYLTTSLTLAGEPERWPTFPSIGRPIQNVRIYILDSCGRLVPQGVPGEIYIYGEGVARGYVNRPELTAERFLPDPFGPKPAARMYRSGDLGKWLPDGSIEFLGRRDYQVKIRGFRIEPGEIEAQLVRHQHIKEAVVIAREDTSGRRRLVAYLTKRDPSTLTLEAICAYLKAELPDYMIPAAFVILDHMPLTTTGKVDRRGLPAPERRAFTSYPHA